MPRFYCPVPLAEGHSLELPAGAARHAQVLRLQPGASVTLFNGTGGEFDATIEQMGRSHVRARIVQYRGMEREAAREVHLAVGMPANERMDWLVEKATELGAASIQPVLAERSVLKLRGERAGKKRAHWQGIAVAACEQCGRNRVPAVRAALDFSEWLAGLAQTALGSGSADGEASPLRLLLSVQADAQPLPLAAAVGRAVILLSGPEGGLTAGEEAAALAAGFTRVTLGPRVLRAETAPIAALSLLA